ncbi:MAG TPA: hypothetical protein VIN93_05180 [Bryobacteraceae bacterium]
MKLGDGIRDSGTGEQSNSRVSWPWNVLKCLEVVVKIFSYVVDHDTGREPNPYFGICTLCRCKFNKKAEDTPGCRGRRNIVELAQEEDWVIGTGGAGKRSAGNGKLIYAMRVDEKLTRRKYVTDSRFKERKPERPRNDFEKDRQFTLVSRYFYYFGADAIRIPERFRHFEKTGPGFRYVKSAEFGPFLEWLKKRKPGEHGEPCCKAVDKPKVSERCKSSC